MSRLMTLLDLAEEAPEFPQVCRASVGADLADDAGVRVDDEGPTDGPSIAADLDPT